MYPKKIIHVKSRRIIYEFSFKMGVLNEKRCKKEDVPIVLETTEEANFQPQMVDETEELPIEVETRDKAFYQPRMVDIIEETEKNKLVESSPEIIQFLLDAQSRSDANINSFTDKIDTVSDPISVVKTPTFPDDNYFTDKMDDRKNKLSECATSFTDKMDERKKTSVSDASWPNWLTIVGHGITEEVLGPTDCGDVVLPYESDSQTNQFSSFE